MGIIIIIFFHFRFCSCRPSSTVLPRFHGWSLSKDYYLKICKNLQNFAANDKLSNQISLNVVREKAAHAIECLHFNLG
jgi:hypothetical protein